MVVKGVVYSNLSENAWVLLLCFPHPSTYIIAYVQSRFLICTYTVRTLYDCTCLFFFSDPVDFHCTYTIVSIILFSTYNLALHYLLQICLGLDLVEVIVMMTIIQIKILLIPIHHHHSVNLQ